MWSLCEVESDGAILPFRSTYGGPESGAPTIGWNHVTTEPGLTLPYMVTDLIAAKLLGERVPRVVRAMTFKPVGQQELRLVKVLGVEVGPEQGLIQTLAEARIREKRSTELGSKYRADGLKTICNAGSYGIFVEVNRKAKKDRVRVHGLGENPFEIDESEVEQPGSDYCPLIGAEAHGGGPPSARLGRHRGQPTRWPGLSTTTPIRHSSPPRGSAGEVSATLAGLNPYSESVPFLKDETENKAPKGECPKDCLGPGPSVLRTIRRNDTACLFGARAAILTCSIPGSRWERRTTDSVRSRWGRDRKDWIAQLWERIIENGAGAADDYAGIPATSEFSLDTESAPEGSESRHRFARSPS